MTFKRLAVLLYLILSTAAYSQEAEGDAESIYDYYAAQVMKDPTNLELNYRFVDAAINAGKYYVAIFTYERLLETHNRTAIRVELVKLYMIVGNYEAARIEYQKILQHDPSYTDTSLSSILYHTPSRFGFYGRISVMGQYDSNANSGTSTGRIGSTGWSIPSLKKEDSFGISSSVFFGGNARLSPRVYIVGDLAANWLYNFDKDLMNNRNSLWWRTSFGARHVSQSRLFEFRVKNDLTRQENINDTPVTNAPGVSLLYTQVMSRHFVNSLTGATEYRRYYKNRPNNGPQYTLAEQVRWLINQNNSLSLSAKGILFDAKIDRYSYKGFELYLSSYNLVLSNVTLSPYLVYRWEFYEDSALFLEDFDRKDRQLRTGMYISFALADKWSLDVNGGYVNNHSNSVLYDYDKYTISAGLSKSF